MRRSRYGAAGGLPVLATEGAGLKDEEIRRRFDGRNRVELLPGNLTAAQQCLIEEIAHALGYRLFATQRLYPVGYRLVYDRDDTPQARRRAELSVARLRAGGPLLPATEPPAPPPPPPPPPAPSPHQPRQRRRPPSEPPPPPPLPAAAPARPRIPPPPSYPPPPPPPPPVAPAF
ncbi:hypothetical protein ACF1G0_22805 [Streptomyces sp. NPDC013953]|uniref:hypothetical protein n=1 Tax=Streptomyces sp. NPDC013953 TaxID=3364868 RepID=UPI0037023092